MIDSLRQLEADAQRELSALTDPQKLADLKVKYLGRKGLFVSVSGRISEVPNEQKRFAGQEMNRVKQALEALFTSREETLQSAGPEAAKKTDTTMPGTFFAPGNLHPLTQVTLDVVGIFERLGFTLVDGPEVETEHYNFEALNIPLNHPARDSFDTFYLDNGKLLRSQTSTVQIRVMETTPPPVRIVAPGRCYRRDAVDATHHFAFHQIEGLCVDRQVSLADLKGTLLAMGHQILGTQTQVRFRPHFFPFTEPSVEYDFSCSLCRGQGGGCRLCKGTGWIEIGGAGMVHPAVFEAVGYDPEQYTGFAFGIGIERIAMIRHGIDDIRLFLESDLRFTRQF